MGNENSVYEFTEHPQANGKLQNGEANGHAIRIVSEGNSASVDAQLTSQSTSQPSKQEKVSSEACKAEGSQKQAGGGRPADAPGNPTQQLELRKEEEVCPTKVPEQSSDHKRTKGTPRQATFSLFKSVSPPADPGNPAQQPVPKEEEASVQPPPVADKEVESKQDTEEKVPLFNKLFKKKTEAKIEVDLPVVETDGSRGQEKPVLVTVKENGLHCEPGKGEEASAQRPQHLGSVLVESKELGVNSDNLHPQQAEHGESLREERPVMNFFKTFASPSKTPKGVSPDVSKDLAKGTKEPEGQSKLEKGSAAKTAEPSASEPKDTDPNPKDSTGGTFSKLFRQKVLAPGQSWSFCSRHCGV